jgi:hypothetical protein
VEVLRKNGIENRDRGKGFSGWIQPIPDIVGIY